ncbi:hypothetical protein HDU92_003459 [Lobulomyces angularis]|nr:hypothetical protein HDU92_003459 [Lobulomyces angularis]
MSSILASFDQLLADVDEFLVEMKEIEESQSNDNSKIEADLPTPPKKNYNSSQTPNDSVKVMTRASTLNTDRNPRSVYTRKAFLNRSSSLPAASKSEKTLPLISLPSTTYESNSFAEETFATFKSIRQSMELNAKKNQQTSSLFLPHSQTQPLTRERKISTLDNATQRTQSPQLFTAKVAKSHSVDKDFESRFQTNLSEKKSDSEVLTQFQDYLSLINLKNSNEELDIISNKENSNHYQINNNYNQNNKNNISTIKVKSHSTNSSDIKVLESKYVYLEEPKTVTPKYDYQMPPAENKSEENNYFGLNTQSEPSCFLDEEKVVEVVPVKKFQKQALSRISPEEQKKIQQQKEKVELLHQEQEEQSEDDVEDEGYSEDEIPRVLNFRFNEQTEIFFTYHKSEYDRVGPKKKSYEQADAEELADEEEEEREEAAAGIVHKAHTHTFKGNIYGD